MKILNVLLMVFVCAGCASVQPASVLEDSDAKKFIATPDKATLYIYRRPALMWARGQTSPITVDGVTVAALRPGHFIVLKVVPGKHAITSATMDTLRVDTEDRKNYFIRETQTITGAWIIQVNEADGEKEVRQCQLLVSLADSSRLQPVSNQQSQ